MIRNGERAAFITAFPDQEDVELEQAAPQPLTIIGMPDGKDRWAAVHALAHSVATTAMKEAVPKPMVIGGTVIMQGAIGNSTVVIQDGRSSFARWTRVSGYSDGHTPRGEGVIANRVGQSVASSEAYAHAYARVLRRNGITCTVETYLD